MKDHVSGCHVVFTRLQTGMHIQVHGSGYVVNWPECDSVRYAIYSAASGTN